MNSLMKEMQSVTVFTNPILDKMPEGIGSAIIENVIYTDGKGNAVDVNGNEYVTEEVVSKNGNPMFVTKLEDGTIINTLKIMTYQVNIILSPVFNGAPCETEVMGFVWSKQYNFSRQYHAALLALNYELRLVKTIQNPLEFTKMVIGKEVTLVKTRSKKLINGLQEKKWYLSFNSGSQGQVEANISLDEEEDRA